MNNKKIIKIEFIPDIERSGINEVTVTMELSEESFEKLKKMNKKKRSGFIKTHATVTVSDFDIKYTVPEISEMDITEK